LTEQELLDYTIPQYLRSYKECLDEELFKQYSLQLITSGFSHSKPKFDDDFQQERISIDQFAQLITDYIRAWSESPLKQTLKMSKKRAKEDIDQLLNRFWLTYKQQVKEKPEKYIGGLYQTCLVLKKV
jgi:hypothetical protein